MAPLLVHQEASIPDLSAEQERNHSRRCGNSHFGKKQNKKVTVNMLNFTFGAFLELQQNFQGFCQRNTQVDLRE